ncbi:MAG: hypothetical protein R3C53_03140 [Pirellulaceae bacterium]
MNKSNPHNESSDAASSVAANSPVSSTPTTGYWSPGLQAATLACIGGGLVAFFVIRSLHPYFAFADLPELGIAPSEEMVAKHIAATQAFWAHNYALDFGVLGLALGAVIGAVATATRRIPSCIAGAASGLVGGAAAGYGAGLMVARTIRLSADQSLVNSTLLHFAVWGTVCGLIVFSISCIQAGVMRALNNLVIAILLGLGIAALYNLGTSLIANSYDLTFIFPTTLVHGLVWAITCSAMLGLGLHFGLRPAPASKTNTNS